MCRLLRKPFGSDLGTPANTHTHRRKTRGSDVRDADRR